MECAFTPVIDRNLRLGIEVPASGQKIGPEVLIPWAYPMSLDYSFTVFLAKNRSSSLMEIVMWRDALQTAISLCLIFPRSVLSLILSMAAASLSFTASLGADSDTCRYFCLRWQVQQSDVVFYLHNHGCVESVSPVAVCRETQPVWARFQGGRMMHLNGWPRKRREHP